MAGPKVFIVKQEHQADHKVFFVDQKHKEKNAEVIAGATLVKQEHQADVKVFVVKYEHKADICITHKNFAA